MEWEDVSFPVHHFFNDTPLTYLLDGFFDAGMLLHALKGVQERERTHEKSSRRRPVGKKLQLNDY